MAPPPSPPRARRSCGVDRMAARKAVFPSKRVRRDPYHAGDAASSSSCGAGSNPAVALARPTAAERELALAMISALKDAAVDPPLLARNVGADRCVSMVATAIALRTGEQFQDSKTAMEAFGVKNTTKPEDLRRWQHRLAQLAAYERDGAVLTVAEQAIVDGRQSAAEETARQQAEAERAQAEAQAKRPDFLCNFKRCQLQREQREACEHMRKLVEPKPAEIKARAAMLAEHNANIKHIWESPGHVGPDWETTWRNAARDNLIERQLLAEPTWECFSSRFSYKRCEVCSNSECDHKLLETCEAWQRIEADMKERARLARERASSAPAPPPFCTSSGLQLSVSFDRNQWNNYRRLPGGVWEDEPTHVPDLQYSPMGTCDPDLWVDMLRLHGFSAGHKQATWSEAAHARRELGRERRHSV